MIRSRSRTLDIPPTARGDAVKKSVLIPTGGTFSSDWRYQYSPIKSWRRTIHIAFVEEAQQFGGVDEVVVVAEMFHDCLVVFGGDRQQTPGGIEQSQGAHASRRQLMQRQHGLRCAACLFMPDQLASVFLPLLGGTKDAMQWGLL